MTEEVAKKAKELYDLKSKLSKDILSIVDKDLFGVNYIDPKRMYCLYGYPNITLHFCAKKLKEFVMDKLNKELERVECEIKELNC